MKNNKKWVTIIELIIVIIILAILWTIAFFSYDKYATYSRDSVRISDVKSLKTTLELYHIEASKFPKPFEPKNITFNFNTVVWEQWTVDENLISRLSRINKVPLDPRYENKYTYSLTQDWLEYQIWTISEGWALIAQQPIISDTYAKASANSSAYIDWNYNEMALLFKMDWLYVMYALPSIILPDLDTNIELSEMWSWSVVIKWKKCLPHSYKAFSDICIIDFIPKLLFIWSNLPMTQEDIMAIIEQLKEIYSGPIFSENELYTSINNGDSNQLFGDILEWQIPEYVFDTWKTIIDIWVDEYIAQYWSWSIDLLSWSTWTWFTSPETWITFLNVNIFDIDSWVVNCSSCIDF